LYIGPLALLRVKQLDHLVSKVYLLLWQVLAGLASPTEGSIALERDTTQRSLSTKVGIVFQFLER
jgi:ABC-type taurine transport system ATPase subunit